MASRSRIIRCVATLIGSFAAMAITTGAGGCGSGGSAGGAGGGVGTGTGTGTSGVGGTIAGSLPGSGGTIGDIEPGEMPDGGSGGSVNNPPHPCVNLECQQTTCALGDCKQKACSGAAKTTVHGTVHDPAGKVPLYNVVVYVPNGAVAPITAGASCDRCDSHIISPVVSTITDTHGNFVLNDVPVGADIPLVIQVGKWRRQIKIANVVACQDTPLADVNQTRLPRNKAEGDIPLIAITTGGADSMECLPRRMGIDDAEFTTEAGTGRIHLYAGQNNDKDTATNAFAPTLNAGAALTRSTTLWGDVDHLKKYDIVILSCEGATISQEKPVTARQAMYSYESLGGRVFASHWQRYWFSHGPAPLPSIGAWDDKDDPASPINGKIDTSFPKGQALSDWLVNVGASTTPGVLAIQKSRDNIQSVDPALARQWITVDVPAKTKEPAHTAIEYLSFNAPLNVPEASQCGRAVYNDLHVSATGNDSPGKAFPLGCEMRDLTAQEKAVEFMLFDLSSCLQDDKKPPMPPGPVN